VQASSSERRIETAAPPRVFILSPANLRGVRGRALLSGGGGQPDLEPLRQGSTVPLARVYQAISSLYFRGKLTYARRFARGMADRRPAVLTITPSRGLVDVDAPVGLADLHELAALEIDTAEPRYVHALRASTEALAGVLPAGGEVVLLGSLATAKYVEPLTEVLGVRLLAPRDFVGRGDMSRGGLLLRAVEAGRELEYGPVLAMPRRGTRPPRLSAKG
jgi:hypothetical protein